MATIGPTLSPAAASVPGEAHDSGVCPSLLTRYVSGMQRTKVTSHCQFSILPSSFEGNGPYHNVNKPLCRGAHTVRLYLGTWLQGRDNAIPRSGYKMIACRPDVCRVVPNRGNQVDSELVQDSNTESECEVRKIARGRRARRASG